MYHITNLILLCKSSSSRSLDVVYNITCFSRYNVLGHIRQGVLPYHKTQTVRKAVGIMYKSSCTIRYLMYEE